MRMKILGTLLAAMAVGGSAACSNFLDAPEAVANPNQPTVAGINQQFVATQTALTLQYTSDLARTACIWIQQCAGTERQYGQLGMYDYGEDAYNASFAQVYTGGGLIDIKGVIEKADAAGDDVYGAVGRVIEVMQMGLAADVWGDIPYSQAVSDTPTPSLDAQQDVYISLQATLDTAITMLASNKGAGPGLVDLYYGGNAVKWARLAHTLKARYALHVAEREGASAYALALAQAQQGLQPGDDFLGIAGDNPQSYNAWYQFLVIQRAGYMFAGRELVDLLAQRSDPRLTHYFLANDDDAYVGADPGDATSSQFSSFTVQDAPAYRQPIVTWQENRLIVAETAFRTGSGSLAASALDAVRQDAGLPTLGTVTLEDILAEKYIVLFQNPEAWNDYKRTCYPALIPAAGSQAVPGRLLYAVGERNSNPNVPAPAAQPARNWNDPVACS
ncbi:MAG: SusD/RagB family nutrient-binding outer membrane lipoprotein [Gemmatimonadota bacterium]